MKKLLIALLTMSLLLTFVACGNDDDNEDEDLSNYISSNVVATSETLADGTYYFETVDTETVRITGYKGSDTPHAVSVPGTVLSGENQRTVVAIADNAFKNTSSITAVTLADSIVTVGDSAFAECASLKTVTMSKNVTAIGERAFFGCVALETVTFVGGNPALTEIEDACFMNCKALTAFNYFGAIKTVGTGAFYGCETLTAVNLAGVETVGAQAFQNCKALATATLPTTLTSVGSIAFGGTALTVANVTYDKTATNASVIASALTDSGIN